MIFRHHARARPVFGNRPDLLSTLNSSDPHAEIRLERAIVAVMKELDWPLRAFCEQRRQRWLDAAYGPHAGDYRCRAETEARMKPEVGGSDG